MSVKNPDDMTVFTREERIELLRARIRLHAALGIDAYPANSSLRRFFGLTDNSAGNISGRRKAGGNGDEITAPVDREIDERENFALLRQEIADCSRCLLSQKKSGIVFGGGNPSCSLMVVGDWSQQEGAVFSPELVFGKAEDSMLEKMMAAIDLKPEDIYVTNCLKCCPGEKRVPDSLCGKTCFSFLEREIALTGPDIICAMGETAAGMLTGSAEPLARLRGKFVRYRYPAGPEILVMPTYHPRFLLRHQEMKKATWLDLQAIKKKLAGKK